MIRWFLRRGIDKFERTWNYDASYMREVLDADPRALFVLSKVQGLTAYRKDVPLAAYCAAGIVSVHGGRLRSLHATRNRDGAARRASTRPSCAPSLPATSAPCLTKWRSRCGLPKRA